VVVGKLGTAFVTREDLLGAVNEGR
jgi:hypothetical protein